MSGSSRAIGMAEDVHTDAQGDERMKVMLLAEVTADSALGGAERVLREQTLVLQHLGHRVAIVARAQVGDHRPAIPVGEATEYRYAVARNHSLAFFWSSVRRSVRAFDQARASKAVDCVLIHQSLAGLGPLLRRRAQASRWIYMCLSLSHEEYVARTPQAGGGAARLWQALHVRARRWVEGLVMRRCSSVIVLSDFMKQRVRNIHGIPESRIHLIPGAADPVRFCPPSDPVAVRRELGLPLNKVVLFTARRLEPRMGLGNLLQAVAELGPEAEDCLVLIAGEGMLRPMLEGMIRDLKLADRARLLGFIPDGELPKYYQASDLVVMPTQELEGFGLVTVEALACGVPVLGTPVGAIPEVLARVDPRLLADGADAKALAAGIRHLLQRFRDIPGERERLSVKGRALVERDYTWARHGEQLEKALRGACAGADSSIPGRDLAARKVLHVITRLDWGGSAQVVMQAVSGHDRSRFEPLVVMGMPEGAEDQGGREAMETNCRRLSQSGVRWVIVPALVRDVHPVKDLAALWALWRLFRREQPAIVHTHTSKAGALGRLAARLAGVPVVVHTPHGHVFYGHFGTMASWGIVQIERLLARWMTWCIALTEDERQEYRARGIGRAEHVAVVPSSIELERFRRMGSVGRKGFPPGFECPADATIVGSVGWLTPVKGHRYLIEALAKLKRTHPKVCGVIVGSGELHQELETLAKELGVRHSLRLLGKRNDVPECVAAMDVFVLPSLNEGMGRALVEAMAVGRPVIASRVGGMPTIVEDCVTGLLVPPGDSEALASAIRTLLDRPAWARELGAAAAKQIGDRFSGAAMVRSIESIYEEAGKDVAVS